MKFISKTNKQPLKETNIATRTNNVAFRTLNVAEHDLWVGAGIGLGFGGNLWVGAELDTGKNRFGYGGGIGTLG